MRRGGQAGSEQRAPEWTPRQREVLDLLVRGQSNSEIAEALGVSLDGAKWHVREILQKLGVDSREEAAEYWRRRNGLRPRLWRMAGGLFGLPLWTKWAVGGAALATAALVGVLFALPQTTSAPPEPSPLPQGLAGASATATGQTAAPFPGLYPHGTTTGLPTVDRAIAAVTSGDPAQISAQAKYFFAPCVAQTEHSDTGPPTPVCAPDGEPGTVLSGYFYGPCEPGWIDRDHFEGSIEGPAGMTDADAYLFAVLEVQASSEYSVNPAYAATKYLAIFQSPGYDQLGGLQGARTVGIGTDGMVLLNPRCGYDARDLLGHLTGFEARRYVLPPKDGAIHRALPATYTEPPNTGVAVVDRVVAAILAGGPVLGDLIDWQPEACAANPPGIGGQPRCPDGTPEGTPIGRILVGGCEPGPLVQGEDLTAWIPSGDDVQLYAVVRTVPTDVLDGDYVALFVHTGGLGFRAQYVGIDEGGIVSLSNGACRGNPSSGRRDRPASSCRRGLHRGALQIHLNSRPYLWLASNMHFL